MSIKAVLVGAALALGVAFSTSSANAGVIDWTLSGVEFDDGAVATGTFTTDAATGAVLGYDITTSAGSALPGFHYDSSTSYLYGDNVFSLNSFAIVSDSAASPYINLAFVNPLTSPGADALVPGAFLPVFTGSWECDNCDPDRQLISGEAISVAGAPEPAIWGLMLLGFAGLGLALRANRGTVATA